LAYVNFYIASVMDGATITHSTGSAVSGYEAKYAFDNNLYSYFKTPGSGASQIDIDMGDLQQVDNFAIALRNYNTTHSGGRILVWGAANAAGTTGVVTMGDTAWANTGQPLYVPFSSPTGGFRRYWFIGLDYSTAMSISGLFLFRKIALAVHPRLPLYQTTTFRDHQQETLGGHLWKMGRNRTSINERTYQWYLTTTQFAALEAAFQLNKGGTYPVMLDDGTATWYLWQIMTPLPKVTEDYDFISATLTFRRMPFPESGYGY